MPAASDYELIDETLHSRHVRLKQAIRLGAEGEFVNTINTMNYGAGLGFTHFSGSIEVFVVSGAMPVKNGSTKLRCTYYVPEQEFPRLIQMSRLFVLALRRGMREDHSIWQHKRDCQRPLLAPGERAIAEWRAWARRISMTGVAGGEDGH
jgi:hypothetical protein